MEATQKVPFEGESATLSPCGSVEALLIVATEPITLEEIASISGMTLVEVSSCLSQLGEFYRQSGRAFFLATSGGGYQIRTISEYEGVVRSFVENNYSERLSKAALEVLAIIAYRQPISKAQIAKIRGVNSDSVVKLLQDRGYIETRDRDSGPGQARLYRTTKVFLEKMGIFSLRDLPDISDFVPSAVDVEAIETKLQMSGREQ